MKILVHDYAGHPFAIGLSRELSRRRHEVQHAFAAELVTPRGVLKRNCTDGKSLEFISVPMNRYYRRDKYRFLRRRSYEMEYGRELGRKLRKWQPDIMISGNTPTEPQHCALRVCQEMGIPFVAWIQDFYSVAVAQLARKKVPLFGSLVGKWYEVIERKTLRESEGIVIITEDFMPCLANYGVDESKVTVIPNWAPLEELQVKAKDNPWSRRNGLHDEFVFLYSGTLAMKHNPDLVLQVALRFRFEPKVKIVVISEGPGAEWLSEQKRTNQLGHLMVLPFQDFGEMPHVLGAGDVLMAVLEPEAGVFSVPSKVLSYHCAQKPLLAAIPSENLAAQIVRKVESGICVEPTDVEGFLKGAERLFRDRQFGTQCGKRARRYAEDNFDIGNVADRFEGFFEKVIRGHGSIRTAR